jgi:nuclear GTP-binding protein
MEAQKKLLAFQDTVRARKAQELARLRKAGGGGSGMDGMVAEAEARAAAYAEGAEASDAAAAEPRALDGNAAAGEQTRRAFYRHLKLVLEKADILLEVLDARDPLGCRAYAAEALALACDPPKRVVLVLNKIDLVPPEVVQKWLLHLRREFPTIAFKSSTQQQRSHLSAPGGGAVNKATESGEVVTGAGAAGADTLLQLIKNYSRSHELKSAVTVGVVGYPNVGKSSVINSLKRSKAVGVSSTPGFTRTLQEVSLDAKVTLIDCPGIIFDDGMGEGGSENNAGLLLRNCISVDNVEDPEGAVDGILGRCAPEKLMMLYGIGAFATTPDFLAAVAIKRGKVTKGGVPDRVNAARAVLQDWNGGKIPFFVLPPEDEGASAGAVAASVGAKGPGRARMTTDADVGSSAIVSSWTKVRAPSPLPPVTRV